MEIGTGTGMDQGECGDNISIAGKKTAMLCAN